MIWIISFQYLLGLEYINYALLSSENWSSVKFSFWCYFLSSHCKWVVFTLFGVQWMMPKRVVVVDLLFGWRKGFGNHGGSFAWNLVPLCLIWKLWSENNNCIFNGVEVSIVELKSMFQLLNWGQWKILQMSTTYTLQFWIKLE